uniref:Uncharacterized protein n=1 Tax=Romanomermis culicivorax TaxID=13658 RepID=A0A915JS52_ROMCU
MNIPMVDQQQCWPTNKPAQGLQNRGRGGIVEEVLEEEILEEVLEISGVEEISEMHYRFGKVDTGHIINMISQNLQHPMNRCRALSPETQQQLHL